MIPPKQGVVFTWDRLGKEGWNQAGLEAGKGSTAAYCNGAAFCLLQRKERDEWREVQKNGRHSPIKVGGASQEGLRRISARGCPNPTCKGPKPNPTLLAWEAKCGH